MFSLGYRMGGGGLIFVQVFKGGPLKTGCLIILISPAPPTPHPPPCTLWSVNLKVKFEINAYFVSFYVDLSFCILENWYEFLNGFGLYTLYWPKQITCNVIWTIQRNIKRSYQPSKVATNQYRKIKSKQLVSNFTFKITDFECFN